PRPGLTADARTPPAPATARSRPSRLAGRRQDSATPAVISDHPAASSATAPAHDVPPNDPPGADRASASVSSPNPAPAAPSATAPARATAGVRHDPPTTESWHVTAGFP